MTDGQFNPTPARGPTPLPRGHYISHERIRDLIKGALDPLPADPVPKSILIHNIIITHSETRGLDITCEVLFEFE